MSLLDNVKQMISGETPASADSAAHPIMSHLMDMVNSPDTGGVSGLMAKFQSNGLGDLMNSWMGGSGGGAISADQISRVIGQDRLAAIGSKLGIQPDEVSNLVAQHLPDVISKLSPKTRLEQG
jgi:uncharacterized protein YidB (DUF937 family)